MFIWINENIKYIIATAVFAISFAGMSYTFYKDKRKIKNAVIWYVSWYGLYRTIKILIIPPIIKFVLGE